jgi:hypothetical protein
MSAAAICWNSKKQTTAAKSSVEAEYTALSVAASEGRWLQQLVNELNFDV